MTPNNMNLKENIANLEKWAETVLDLKKKHRQRRPIVIEFCGSPKSGKTSCINSLNIFLKRNDFKTIVLTERASICPISNKQSPAFNVWTCTSTINELNKHLDSARNGHDIDIIIADRGIFDALCWFQWLKDQNNMDNEEYMILSQFATLYRWQKNIDLIYVFESTPEISIEREYATLLTQKRGSIMKERVLQQYRSAIKTTKAEYNKAFRSIHTIDTTNLSQNEVSFEVTTKTLDTLREMLMEKIGYINKDDVSLVYGLNNFSELQSQLNAIQFDLRDVVEENNNYLQPIPIAVITNESKDKILCIKKTERSTSKKSPESGKLLLYAGGHIRKEDTTANCKEDFLKTSINTLQRELEEELGISISIDDDSLPFVLYCPDNPISKKHVAIVWIISVDEDTTFTLDKYEIVQRKGTSKSGTFISLADLNETDFSLDSWSQKILIEYFSNYLSKDYKAYITNELSEQLSLLV